MSYLDFDIGPPVTGPSIEVRDGGAMADRNQRTWLEPRKVWFQNQAPIICDSRCGKVKVMVLSRSWKTRSLVVRVESGDILGGQH